MTFGKTIGVPTCISSGVPQGSILSSYLFAAHKGSLALLSSRCYMIKWVDDILLLQPFSRNADLQNLLHSQMSHAQNWCNDHGLLLNKEKTKTMIVAKQSLLRVTDTSLSTSLATNIKILGVTFTTRLKWSNLTSSVCRKASSRLFILRWLREFMTKHDIILRISGLCPKYSGI